jgi:hypothetical protein
MTIIFLTLLLQVIYPITMTRPLIFILIQRLLLNIVCLIWQMIILLFLAGIRHRTINPLHTSALWCLLLPANPFATNHKKAGILSHILLLWICLVAS